MEIENSQLSNSFSSPFVSIVAFLITSFHLSGTAENGYFEKVLVRIQRCICNGYHLVVLGIYNPFLNLSAHLFIGYSETALQNTVTSAEGLEVAGSSPAPSTRVGSAVG